MCGGWPIYRFQIPYASLLLFCHTTRQGADACVFDHHARAVRFDVQTGELTARVADACFLAHERERKIVQVMQIGREAMRHRKPLQTQGVALRTALQGADGVAAIGALRFDLALKRFLELLQDADLRVIEQ